MTEMRQRLLNTKASLEYLGDVGRNTIYKLRREGLLHPVFIGRAVRYTREDLDQAIAQLQAKSE